MPLKLSKDEPFVPVRRRIKRENLKDADFQSGERVAGEPAYLSKYVVWYPWTLAVSPTRPKKQRRRWRRRKNGIGYFKRGLYKLVTDKYSMYEVGVMVPRCKDIIVVYYKFIRYGVDPRKSIYQLLLKNKEVMAEVNNIVKRQGAIWFRRGYLNINGELMFSFIREYVRLNFSYPWRSHDPTTGVNRFLKKGKGFLISGNLFLQSGSESAASLKKSPSAEASRQQHLMALNKTSSLDMSNYSKPSAREPEEALDKKSETGIEKQSSMSELDANENAPTEGENYNTSSCPVVLENESCTPNETDKTESPSPRGLPTIQDGKVTGRSDSQDTTESNLSIDSKVEKIHIGPTFRSYVDAPCSWSSLNVYTPSSPSSVTADTPSSRSSVNMNPSKSSFSMNASKSSLNVDASKSSLTLKASKTSLNIKASKSSLNTKGSKSSLSMKGSNLQLKKNASKSTMKTTGSKVSLKTNGSSKSSLKTVSASALNMNTSNRTPSNVDTYLKRVYSKKHKASIRLKPIKKQESVIPKTDLKTTKKSTSISTNRAMAKNSAENTRATNVTNSKGHVTLIQKSVDEKENSLSVSASRKKIPNPYNNDSPHTATKDKEKLEKSKTLPLKDAIPHSSKRNEKINKQVVPKSSTNKLKNNLTKVKRK